MQILFPYCTPHPIFIFNPHWWGIFSSISICKRICRASKSEIFSFIFQMGAFSALWMNVWGSTSDTAPHVCLLCRSWSSRVLPELPMWFGTASRPAWTPPMSTSSTTAWNCSTASSSQLANKWVATCKVFQATTTHMLPDTKGSRDLSHITGQFKYYEGNVGLTFTPTVNRVQSTQTQEHLVATSGTATTNSLVAGFVPPTRLVLYVLYVWFGLF